MRTAEGPVPTRIRLGWGLDGAMALAPTSDVVVVVDVLSFTTTVSVALDIGISVLPYRWSDDSAADFARQHDASLAAGRTEADGISLSPASVRRAKLPPRRMVLASPNGATIALVMEESGRRCVAACLRNASAVAHWLDEQRVSQVALIAAGERCADGSLRQAEEDLWGAGAVISALTARRALLPAPDAARACAAVCAIQGRPAEALFDTASGRELSSAGFAADVEIAAEIDSSPHVPLLFDGAFVAG